MSTTVDSLDIQITATSTKASKSIDQLVGKLNILSTSLKGINGSNLSGLANGVAKLGQSVQTLLHQLHPQSDHFRFAMSPSITRR